jgi:hypothetical protein
VITVQVMIGYREMAHIRIENLNDSTDPEVGNYSIQFAVDTAEGVAIYQRHIESFPRKKYNTLALLRQALQTLEEKELTLDGDPDLPRPSGDAGLPGYLARRLRGAL